MYQWLHCVAVTEYGVTPAARWRSKILILLLRWCACHVCGSLVTGANGSGL